LGVIGKRKVKYVKGEVGVLKRVTASLWAIQ